MLRARCFALGVYLVLQSLSQQASAQDARTPVVYHVDCSQISIAPSAERQTTQELHSLQEANAVALRANDTLLFRRGTTCKGALLPRGNGFSIGAYGEGQLPRIEAGPTDEAALLLSNQERITISSLELIGGTSYGVHVTGDKGTMHSITLQNLTVRDVRR